MTRLFSKIIPHAWWILLLVTLIVHWIASERRIDRVEAISSMPTWSVSEPEESDSSQTGWAKGQRSLIVAGHHNVSFNWIRESQLSVEEGKWRLREINYDTYPEGRKISRTSVYRWWIVSVGWVRSTLTGESIGLGIERGTLYADPVLFSLLIIAGTLYCARSLNTSAGLGFVFGCLCIFPLSGSFQPGAPDSHSLSWVLAVGSVLPFFVAAFRPQSKIGIHLVVAGAFSGVAFWNDAESQLPLLLAIAIGGLSWEFVAKGRSGVVWRYWAVPAAVVIVVASIFEFAPNHFSWSLDAVSPLHALILLGFSEVLTAVSVARREGIKSLGTSGYLLAGIGVLSILAWPFVGFLSETGSLLASDFYAREIANHPSGGLASNLGVWLGKASGGAKFAVLLPCLLLLLSLFGLVNGKIENEKRGLVLFLVSAGAFLLLLSFIQIRWFNLFDVFAILLMAVSFGGVCREGIVSRLKQFSPALLVLPGLFVGFHDSGSDVETSQLTAIEKQALIERDYGYWLKHYSVSEDIVLFSTPMFSATSAYYGGFKSIVSGEGSNASGFEAAVRLAAADSLQEVSILLESLEISHIAIPLWDPMVERMVQLGVGNVAEVPPNVFLLSLRDWDVPYFLRPLNYPASPDRSFKGLGLPSFSVQAELEPDVALSNLADFFVERGQEREMYGIREVLKQYPRSLYALSSIASIDQAMEAPGKTESLDAFIPYLSRRAARNLPLDRRVSIAMTLFKAKQRTLAKEQVVSAMELVNTDSLRTLTPNSVASLVALSRTFGVPFSDELLKAEALSLVPVELRGLLGK